MALTKSNQNIDTTISKLDSIPTLENNTLILADPIPFTFETIGWKILFSIIGMLLLLAVFLLIRRYLSRAYRREAINLIQNLKKQYINGNDSALTQIFITLKQVAISTYGRDNVAALEGKLWLQYLDQKGNTTYWVNNIEEISSIIHKNTFPTSSKGIEFFNQAKNWINVHPTT